MSLEKKKSETKHQQEESKFHKCWFRSVEGRGGGDVQSHQVPRWRGGGATLHHFGEDRAGYKSK